MFENIEDLYFFFHTAVALKADELDKAKDVYTRHFELALGRARIPKTEVQISVSVSPVWSDENATEEQSRAMYRQMYDMTVEALEKFPGLSVTLFATSETEAKWIDNVVQQSDRTTSSAGGMMQSNKVARRPESNAQLHNEVVTSFSMSSSLQVNGLARSLGKVDQYASAMMLSLGKYNLGFGGEVALENRQQLHKAIYALYALGACGLTPAMKLQGAVSYVSEHVTSKVFRNVSWE